MPAMFIDLAQNCAPQIPVETVAAVVSVESDFRPFAIRINSDHRPTAQPETKAEAIESASMLIAEGHDLDLGLTGINSDEFGRLGVSLGDTFDPCLNLAATAALLDSYYRIALRAGESAASAEATMLQRYFGKGDASLGRVVGYDSQILVERARLSGSISKIEIVGTAKPASPKREGPSSSAIGGNRLVDENPPRHPASVPRWDVFGSGLQSTVLVFSNGQ